MRTARGHVRVSVGGSAVARTVRLIASSCRPVRRGRWDRSRRRRRGRLAHKFWAPAAAAAAAAANRRTCIMETPDVACAPFNSPRARARVFLARRKLHAERTAHPLSVPLRLLLSLVHARCACACD